MADFDLVIRGGTVVDGSAAAWWELRPQRRNASNDDDGRSALLNIYRRK